MKKFLLVCLLVSVGFNLYLYKSQYAIVDDFADDNYDKVLPESPMKDQVKLAQSSIKKSKDCEPKEENKVITRKVSRPSESIKQDDEEDRLTHLREDVIRQRLEESHDKWIEKSDNFFFENLRLSREQVARYRELSAQRQKDISNYFEQKRSQSNTSEAQTYLFTTEDTIFMGKLAQKYEKQLKEVFGDKNYRRHKKFIKSHNSGVMSDEFVQVVEF